VLVQKKYLPFGEILGEHPSLFSSGKRQHTLGAFWQPRLSCFHASRAILFRKKTLIPLVQAFDNHFVSA
jgi:hypothetical protein